MRRRLTAVPTTIPNDHDASSRAAATPQMTMSAGLEKSGSRPHAFAVMPTQRKRDAGSAEQEQPCRHTDGGEHSAGGGDDGRRGVAEGRHCRFEFPARAATIAAAFALARRTSAASEYQLPVDKLADLPGAGCSVAVCEDLVVARDFETAAPGAETSATHGAGSTPYLLKEAWKRVRSTDRQVTRPLVSETVDDANRVVDVAKLAHA